MDIKFMKRALQLAKKGEGFVNPNPMVGSVIVIDDEVVAEGWHEVYGGNHAEINALANAPKDLSKATMYVTLEPCSHYGKTPPCVDRIIESGIKKVVISMEDPNPLVSGNGIRLLRKAGIEVIENVLKEESQSLNEVFIKYISTKIPFVLMKTAMTLDGKIASKTGDSKWITSEESRKYVHSLRHKFKGIMVGIGTVIQDDPMLNIRHLEGDYVNPIRIVVDTNGRIPLNSKIIKSAKEIPVILAVSEGIEVDKEKSLKIHGVEIIKVPLLDNRLNLKYLLIELGKLGIDSILLEGGGNLNWGMLSENLVDKIEAFVGSKIIGGSESKTSVEGEGYLLMSQGINLEFLSNELLGKDILIKAKILKF